MENKENEPQPKNLSLCMEERPKRPSFSWITQSAVKFPQNNIRVFPMILDFQKDFQMLQENTEPEQKYNPSSFLESTNSDQQSGYCKTESEREEELIDTSVNKKYLSAVHHKNGKEGSSVSQLHKEDTEEDISFSHLSKIDSTNSFCLYGNKDTAEKSDEDENSFFLHRNGDNKMEINVPKLEHDYLKSILESDEELDITACSSNNPKDNLHHLFKQKTKLQTPAQNKDNVKSLVETKTTINNPSFSSTNRKNDQLETPRFYSKKNSYKPLLEPKNEMEKPWFTSTNYKSEMETPRFTSIHNNDTLKSVLDTKFGMENPRFSSTHHKDSLLESKTEIEAPSFSSTHHKDIQKFDLQGNSDSSNSSSKSILKEFKSRKSDEDLGVTPISSQQPRVQCTIDVSSFMKTRPPFRTTRKSNEERVKRNSGQMMDVSFKRLCVNDVDYIVLKELGRGGSSIVYHCFNMKTETECAIKSVDLNQDSNAVTGYINEVRTLQRLQHCKRVIKMHTYQILQEDKKMYVVLEKGGADLHSILKDLTNRSDQLPLYIIIFYWMEMLHAVKEIHSNGVIHSDLKPANFLEAGGKIKLIDFGISSCVQQDNTSVIKNVAVGTFSYISPEALCGNKSSNYDSPNYGKPKFKIGYKSDVWSLGCILYQLVYKRPPFHHLAHSAAKICSIIDPNHKIDYPEIKSIPHTMIQTIKDCLQYDIKSRPSIDDLISRYGQYYC